jgi:hypothetical protein
MYTSRTTTRRLLSVAAALFLFSQGASATNIKTFDFNWTGSGAATGQGTITFDLDASYGTSSLAGAQLDFTVSNAIQGNGSFSKADFAGLVFVTSGFIDYSQNLVGQANFVDFNVISVGAAPSGTDIQTVGTNGGAGDTLVLTNLKVAAGTGGGGGGGGSPVPEPASWALLGIGAAAMRHRRRRAG